MSPRLLFFFKGSATTNINLPLSSCSSFKGSATLSQPASLNPTLGQNGIPKAKTSSKEIQRGKYRIVSQSKTYSSKKKKKKSKFKPNKKDGPDSKGAKTNKISFRKHPLRVPGMELGEICYICKGVNHIAKNCPEKDQWEKNKICLLCRHRGHSLKNCPDKTDETIDSKFCYNCGVAGHPLSRCPQPLQDANEYEGKPRVTKIVSGDDLEDDFMMEEGDEGNNSTSMSTSFFRSSK
ncbi:hypothetical protein MKX01_020955 [Papaver californicum]|nr:hypothetical protein MKX01_020955 [Papaver californicum]